MAGVRSENKNGVGNAMNDVLAAARKVAPSAPVRTIRDALRHMEQPSTVAERLRSDKNPYEHIVGLISCMKLDDDGIAMNQKITAIETEFCSIVQNKDMLCESMEYINDKALSDRDTALKFAILISSRRFDGLALENVKIRNNMLQILQTNFQNADAYRAQDKSRLHNSIALLGEYYFRVRLSNNSPISILGESLLRLLIQEISEVETISEDLAELLVSQVTLNGTSLRAKHKADLEKLLLLVRRNLIEQPSQPLKVRTLLFMTLDLYYNNFTSLDRKLEAWYVNILTEDGKGKSNNDAAPQQQQAQAPQAQQNSPRQRHSTIYSEDCNNKKEKSKQSSGHKGSHEAQPSSGSRKRNH